MKRLAVAFAGFAFMFAAHGQDANFLPNSTLTPGSVRPGVTTDQVCNPRWAAEDFWVHIPISMVVRTFEVYKLAATNERGEFKFPVASDGTYVYGIDRLISNELGGKMTLDNLWPVPVAGKCNIYQKAKLQEQLLKEVCSKTLSLFDAQNLLVANWTKAYDQRFGSCSK